MTPEEKLAQIETEIGTFFKEAISGAKNTMIAIGKFFTKEEPTISAIIQAAAADAQLLITAVEQDKPAITAVLTLIASLAKLV